MIFKEILYELRYNTAEGCYGTVLKYTDNFTKLRGFVSKFESNTYHDTVIKLYLIAVECKDINYATC